MTFGEHLEDLRLRILLALGGLAPLFIGALVFGKPLLTILIAPVLSALHDADLPAVMLATNPVETFGAYIRVATIVTLVTGSPWVIYQAWRFVAPGLYAHEKRFVRVLLPMSAALSVAGVVFLYVVILPVILAFFIGFGTGVGAERPVTGPLPQGVELATAAVLDHDPEAPEVGQWWVNNRLMQLRICVATRDGSPVVLGSELTSGSGVIQQYRISEYVKLFFGLALAFAIGFQTPVVVLILGWAGLVTPTSLGRYRRHAIMIIVIVCAVLTPPDPFSMVLLAAPLYILYEAGSLLLRLMPARVERDDEPMDAEGV